MWDLDRWLKPHLCVHVHACVFFLHFPEGEYSESEWHSERDFSDSQWDFFLQTAACILISNLRSNIHLSKLMFSSTGCQKCLWLHFKARGFRCKLDEQKSPVTLEEGEIFLPRHLNRDRKRKWLFLSLSGTGALKSRLPGRMFDINLKQYVPRHNHQFPPFKHT